MPNLKLIKALQKGFSLVELLITFGIIALIVTFTVPQLFQSSTSTYSSKKTSAARDAAFMILSAYRQYKSVTGTVPTTMNAPALSPYMSYLRVDTSGSIDDRANLGSFLNCSSTQPCLVLSGGGKLLLSSLTFNGANTTNAIRLYYDPDGVNSGTGAVDNDSKSLWIALYYDGAIRTRNTVRANTCDSGNCGYGPAALYDPRWFTGF